MHVGVGLRREIGLSKPSAATSPRRLAFEVLQRVESKDAYANLLLDARLNRITLSRADRALATELVYGVLRWRGKLDWIAGPRLDRPGERLDPVVRTLLRLGIYQLTCLSRVPAFAAIDETVNLAHAMAPRAAGFVNALLRAVQRAGALPEPDPINDPVAYWTGPGSHPGWFATRWLDRLGVADAGALMAANNQVPSVSVAVNDIRGDRQAALSRLQSAGRVVTASRYFPEMLRLDGGSPADLPGFVEGLFVPMDEGAPLAVHAMDLAPGLRVLDACAGGGGKTALIAAALAGQGEIVACDQSARAVRRLTEACGRLGLATVTPTLYDARDAGSAFPDRFDRVLIDAPCSGLGTVRRRPEIKWRRRPEDLPRLAALQCTLLQGVAGALKPGGLLVYSTCSLEPEETDAVIAAFLATRADFTMETPPAALEAIADGQVLRAWPHRHGTDGFYAVRLRRIR